MLIHSLLRHYQDKEIEKIEPIGDCVDLGGGRPAYVFKGHTIHTTDINPERNPDYVFDLNVFFPLPDDTFDTVLCFNTLEHLHDPETCVYETCRIMKKGGKAYFCFPFIFPYHAAGPQRDYLRYSHEWAEHKFKVLGFSEVKVKKMGGNCTVIADLIGNTIPTRLLSGIAKTMLFIPAVSIDWILEKAGRRNMYHSVWIEATK